MSLAILKLSKSICVILISTDPYMYKYISMLFDFTALLVNYIVAIDSRTVEQTTIKNPTNPTNPIELFYSRFDYLNTTIPYRLSEKHSRSKDFVRSDASIPLSWPDKSKNLPYYNNKVFETFLPVCHKCNPTNTSSTPKQEKFVEIEHLDHELIVKDKQTDNNKGLKNEPRRKFVSRIRKKRDNKLKV